MPYTNFPIMCVPWELEIQNSQGDYTKGISKIVKMPKNQEPDISNNLKPNYLYKPYLILPYLYLT